MKEKVALIIILFSNLLFSQEPLIDTLFIQKDSLPKSVENVKILEKTQPVGINLKKYSNDDLKIIDSLLIASKFESPLFNNTDYVIKNADLVSNTEAIVSSEVLKSRLEAINSYTEFNLQYNPALEKVINNYVKYRSKYYPALMARAKYYFPIFEQYLDEYNIPMEMKYLAIVESALHPKAKSRVGATGLWQFMYGTGKQFKLNVNTYVDERQDPVKATKAACKFLSQLYDRFNDWDLALAAYNSGPGNVLKAIKRSGGYRNYWNIRAYLPMETASYVPAFYATMYIFTYADELGIHSEKPNLYSFETDTIQIKRRISFDHITQKTGISDEVLTLLNPQYKMDIIPHIKKKSFSVRLPRNKILDFLDKEQEIYALATEEDATREKPLPKYFEISKSKRTSYKVRNGDYLGKIARKFGVRVSQLKRWNNMRNTKLKVGKRLSIYPKKR